MPPIMGAAAFIIAEFTGTSYLFIVAISVVPAILYFGSVGLFVYIEAKKKKLYGISRDKLPPLKPLLKKIYFQL
jgi:TRAP-type uncharacterized transport system fused permease subunit